MTDTAKLEWVALLRDMVENPDRHPPRKSPSDGEIRAIQERPPTEEEIREAEAFIMANLDLMPEGLSIDPDALDASGIRPIGERINMRGGDVTALDRTEALSSIAEPVLPVIRKDGGGAATSPDQDPAKRLADMFRGAQVAIFTVNDEDSDASDPESETGGDEAS